MGGRGGTAARREEGSFQAVTGASANAPSAGVRPGGPEEARAGLVFAAPPLGQAHSVGGTSVLVLRAPTGQTPPCCPLRSAPASVLLLGALGSELRPRPRGCHRHFAAGCPAAMAQRRCLPPIPLPRPRGGAPPPPSWLRRLCALPGTQKAVPPPRRPRRQCHPPTDPPPPGPRRCCALPATMAATTATPLPLRLPHSAFSLHDLRGPYDAPSGLCGLWAFAFPVPPWEPPSFSSFPTSS